MEIYANHGAGFTDEMRIENRMRLTAQPYFKPPSSVL